MNRPVDPADNHAQLSWCTSVPTVSVLPSRPERSEPTCKTRLHVACHRVATPPRSRLFLRSREPRAVSGEDKSAVVVGRGGHTAGAADRISRAGGMCECNTSIIPSASIFGIQCKRRDITSTAYKLRSTHGTSYIVTRTVVSKYKGSRPY